MRHENRLHAGHGQRRARIDVLHAGVRQRAEEQFAKEHSVRVVVFGVLRKSRDLCVEVGSWVIFSDQSVPNAVHAFGGLHRRSFSFHRFLRHCWPSAYFRRRASVR